jgi:hypothetical protein
MIKLRTAVASGLLASLLVVLLASPSAASCAPHMSLTEAVGTADLVVVGTVTATRSANRIATVSVDEIWKGDASAVIEIAGGPEADNSLTTVDRTYDIGTRYLFFVFEPARHGSGGTFGAGYEDNVCSNTRPYSADLDALRPPSARNVAAASPSTTPPATAAPTPTPAADDGIAPVVLLAFAAVACCAVVLAIGRRVRRRLPAVGR